MPLFLFSQSVRYAQRVGKYLGEDAQSRQYRHLLLENQSTNSEIYNKLQI